MDLAAVLNRPEPAYALALAMAGLALFVLYVDFSSRTNRAFAVLLLLRSWSNLVQQIGYRGLVVALDDAVIIATPAVVLWFLLEYHWRSRVRRGHRATLPVLFGGMAVVQAVHHLKVLPLEVVDFPSALLALRFVSYSLLALVLAHDATRTANVPFSRSLLLISGVFALDPLFTAVVTLRDTPLHLLALAPPPQVVAKLHAVSYLLLAGTLAVLVRHLLRSGDARMRRGILVYVGALLAVMASLFWLVATAPPGVDIGFTFNPQSSAFDRLWTFPVPFGVAYALLRFQLFDLDLRLKATLRRSTILAAFAAAFFVGSNAVESALPVDGTLAGVAMAGVVAALFRPLEKGARRFVDRLMPGVEDAPAHVHGRKVEVYQAALESVFADGVVSEKDRRLLDRMREKLGLGEAEARRLEAELARRTGARAPASSAAPA